MRGRGFFPLVVPMLAILALTVACGATKAPSGPISFKDDAGHQVTLKKPALRIISLGPSDTETVLALGLRKDLVAADRDSFLYLPDPYRRDLSGVQNVGDSVAQAEIERIVSLHPSLVLAAYNAPYVAKLTSLGLNVAVLDPTSIAGILRDVTLVGRATGDEAAAVRVDANLRRQIAAVRRAVAGQPRPTVFVELDPTLYTVGPGSFIDSLIKAAGGVNVVDGVVTTAYPQVSSEVVLKGNPDVIILQDQGFGGTPAAVAARPGWSAITAVKEGRIVTSVNPDLLSNPGPAVGEGLLELARALHPGLEVPGF